MGEIRRVIYKTEALPTPPHNNRLTVECCENVHLHYRNIRLEFSADEFLFLLQKLKTINEDEIRNFKYGPNEFRSVVMTMGLPEKTEFNKRLQLESQTNGDIHIHYRNLRIEL